MENVIYAYTRKEAIEDGALGDVSELAKEAGFRIPVCITTGVVETCQPPEGLKHCQDYKGRLWDVLFMAVIAFRNAKKRIKADSSPPFMQLEFKVIFAETEKRNVTKTMWLVFNECEGFTIMYPEEY